MSVHKTIEERLAAMKEDELRSTLREILVIMYVPQPDDGGEVEWGPDTLQNVDQVLSAQGFVATSRPETEMSATERAIFDISEADKAADV